MLKVNYVEDTRPIKNIVLTQPKGTFDLTLYKNNAGSRIRVASKSGDTINIAVAEVANFVEALTKIAKQGAKSSSRAA